MEAARASEASSFGKYTLVAKLATGGMAEIFLARLLSDGGFEKLVCIKRILPHLAKDPQFVAMFLDEARVVARISHPNVCQVFELGEIDGPVLHRDGVPRGRAALGVPARRLLPERRPIRGSSRAFGVQACEGLHHAHQLKGANGEQLGVVHRDISPQNLFVTIDGIVKVLDFGIAKVQDQSVRTSTGAVKGTYAYMSPEQLRGEKVDRRADVWALGTVLWETLAQRHLFKRDTEFLTFQAITTDPIPDICEVRPDVPPLLGDAIARALSRDREHRFATARALGEALAQAVGPLGGVVGARGDRRRGRARVRGLMDEQRRLLEHGARRRHVRSRALESAGRCGDATLDDAGLEHRGQARGGAGRGRAVRARAAGDPLARGRRAVGERLHAAARWRRPVHARAIAARASLGAAAGRAPQTDRRRAGGSSRSRPVPCAIVRRDRPDGISDRAGHRRIRRGCRGSIAFVAVLVAGGRRGDVLHEQDRHRPKAAASATSRRAAGRDRSIVTPPPPPRRADRRGASQLIAVDELRSPQREQPDAADRRVMPCTRTRAADRARAAGARGPAGFHHDRFDAGVRGDLHRRQEVSARRPSCTSRCRPGKHSVEAVSSSGTTRTLSITIESGKTAPVRRIEW